MGGLLRLLSLAGLAVVGWWLSRVLRGAARPPAARPGAAARSGGNMVRDRVCNTFLPRSLAVEARVGPTTHYFCSQACRARFLRESGAVEPV